MTDKGAESLAQALVAIAVIAALVTLVLTGHEELAGAVCLLLFLVFMCFVL